MTAWRHGGGGYDPDALHRVFNAAAVPLDLRLALQRIACLSAIAMACASRRVGVRCGSASARVASSEPEDIVPAGQRLTFDTGGSRRAGPDACLQRWNAVEAHRRR